jgi:MoaA/NifB/PqqE/SkfB family radical SAM enzyme
MQRPACYTSAVLKWLEISADYECNNRCVGCFSVQSDGPRMATPEVIENLRVGRQEGVEWLWLGGGEPTIRRDLFAIVGAARKLGYTRIKLQTNGMLLAYPEFTRRCVASGVTEINFSIKGATAASHDRLAQTPGCHELMLKGILEAGRANLAMEGDILVYRSNMHELPEMISTYFALGLQRFNLWLFSTTSQGSSDLQEEVPRIAQVMPFVAAAMDLKLSSRPDFITSLHTPPCTVAAPYAACRFHPADLDLLVANPGGYRFRLEESPIEGGLYLDRCSQCSLRPRCNGLRQDYLAIHGDAEFQPVV